MCFADSVRIPNFFALRGLGHKPLSLALKILNLFALADSISYLFMRVLLRNLYSSIVYMFFYAFFLFFFFC